jgi:hypothetical protein
LKRLHGKDERVGVRDFAELVDFFYLLVKNANGMEA